MNSRPARDTEEGMIFTRIYSAFCRLYRCRKRKISSEIIVPHVNPKRGSSSQALPAYTSRSFDTTTGPGRSVSLDYQRSSCGNYELHCGKVVDIVLPYQRFALAKTAPPSSCAVASDIDASAKTAPPSSCAVASDIDASESGPMLTKWHGPFDYT